MKCVTEEKANIVIMRVEGRIGPDATLISEKVYDCIDQGKHRILVDMKLVNWMSSTGLGILIGSLTTLRNHNGDLKLLNVGEKVREILRVTKLDKIFETYEDEEKAIGSFA
jgi:anti-sigma B factor antagonist